jgi:NAD(P)-dependent dehydrogenase (short-subunit alcohol dehydrogenase family)
VSPWRPSKDAEAADLTGRSAVVTGAGSGIGRSIALLLAQRGTRVYISDVDEQRTEAVARELREAGGEASTHTVDVTDADAMVRFADTVFLDGPLDLLFNNAGIGMAGALVDTTLEDWRRLIDVNLMGVVHGLNAFLPRLLAQGRPARIVNTASMAGLVPAAGLAAYSATKAAVVALTEALEIELIDSTVRVSALCPGIIDTAIVSATTMRGDWAARRARTVEIYAKRGTSPDTVARQALTAVRRGRRIVPAPRYQVVPHWWLKRAVPRAGRALSILSYRFLSKDE